MSQNKPQQNHKHNLWDVYLALPVVTVVVTSLIVVVFDTVGVVTIERET